MELSAVPFLYEHVAAYAVRNTIKLGGETRGSVQMTAASDNDRDGDLTRGIRDGRLGGRVIESVPHEPEPSIYWHRRSATGVLVVYIASVTLRTTFLTSPPTRGQVFSVVDDASPSISLPLDLGHCLQPEPEPELRPLEEHTYTTDGLLVVNPNGPHPIFELIHKAKIDWEAKLARASKSLDAAVVEYKRRYKRPPPLGFDKWWDYVVRHDVRLPDEYDEIYHDLEPFWGIDPYDLAMTQEELEHRAQVVTVQKTPSGSRLEILSDTLPDDRRIQLRATVDNILNLLNDVQDELPPLRMSFSPHDNPSMLSDWRIKNMTLEAAARGTTVAQADFPSIDKAEWIQACPPDSPARLYPPSLSSLSSLTSNTSSSPKTFIASHRDTMNPCTHPSLLTLHGQFLSHKAGPYPQLPYGWTSGEDAEEKGDVRWDMKVDERLAWRGSTTGIHASPTSLWIHAHRARLITLANTLAGNVSILPVPEDASTPVGEPEEVRLGRVNPAWMDVAFAGTAVGCDKDGGTCKKMESLWEFRKWQERSQEGRYKFIFDVDGNGWSARFKRLITSNSLVFKATIYPEWFMSRIAPWVHYVPIQISYTDLHDTVAFFRGHDDLAAHIAAAGKEWSQHFWRKEDMTAYLYRLLLEYARVSSLDRASMNYGE
ncbi:glycosyl transferase family 90-domain-containing protein [Melanogaster broomeanus]|nr:glycosyl transferase family 90-domain-containing protein [Melanogaster broomeanus]